MDHEKTPWDVLDAYKGKFFTGDWPTLPELFRITAERYPTSPCFTIYEPGRISLSYAEALLQIERCSRYLASIGIGRDDKVVVTGKNSPEWAVAYLGILFTGAVVVPIDYQLKTEETEILIRASDAKAAFVDEEKFDEIDERKLGLLMKMSLSRKQRDYIYDLDSNSEAKITPSKEEDLAAILYTSGTTGTPKGVMLTHGNFVSDCFLAQGNLTILHSDNFYALLPIHHSYTMLAVFIEAISVGAEITFGKTMATSRILKDLKDAKITMFLGVPLLFNKVLAGIMRGVKAKGIIVYGLIRLLMGVSGFIKVVFRKNPGKRLFKSVLDKASLTTIRNCISGGGPLAPSIFRQYNQLGIDFVQGYGLTETSPIIALNPPEHYKVTSVGKVTPRTQMRVLEKDERGCGEIIVKGPMVMKGYYKNPEETAKVFTEDGWFKTGDIGYLDSDGYLYLTGRAKSMIVTEGGKNVYPEELENKFQLFEEVEQVLIRGYLMDKKLKAEGIEALIYPSEDYFKTYFAKRGRLGTQEIKERIEELVSKVNYGLLPYQRITKIAVLDAPMEMTTTKKIKRFAMEKED